MRPWERYEDRRYLTLSQAARVLGVSGRSLLRQVLRGQWGRRVRGRDGQYLLPEAEVLARARRRDGLPPPPPPDPPPYFL